MAGKELYYIQDAVNAGKLSGNGKYTKKCQLFFQEYYKFGKCLLTSSCTDALEMAAILLRIEPGDEVIMPSYTFVSTANAFILRGAKIIFADSRKDHPGIDEDKIESLISEKTKAIVSVHYSGVACDMEKILNIAKKYNLFVIEDAAQAIDSYYTFKNGDVKALGSMGHLSAFSFHETKNIISGEGGMLVINDEQFAERAEIIWEKGTNRASFFRGEINKYDWVDYGSSFLPSEITAAFLWGQLESISKIQKRRLKIWNSYYQNLEKWAKVLNIGLPYIPTYATNNGHIFYLVLESNLKRNNIIRDLGDNNILSVFHYQSLHKSGFYKDKYSGDNLVESDRYSECLVRLPLYYELNDEEITLVTNVLINNK